MTAPQPGYPGGPAQAGYPPPLQPTVTQASQQQLEAQELTAAALREFWARLFGAGLTMLLLSVAAILWGIDGAFKVLFTAFTAWAIYSYWLLFIKQPPA